MHQRTNIVRALSVSIVCGMIRSVADNLIWIAMIAEREKCLEESEKAPLKKWSTEMHKYADRLRDRYLHPAHFYFPKDGD